MRGKILIIEDADSLRNDIMEMLSYEGFEVRGAENGITGIETAREYHPDLIICDIMMPEMDGYGVLNTLRQDEEMIRTPFIFLTARTDRTEVRHGMGLGADDYLTKPFVAAELLSTIHARLETVRDYNKMAEQRVRELSNSIITALPHELRTPLNTIIGFSDMLIAQAQHLTSDQVVEWSHHINTAAQRLYRLVENYLIYVRAQIAANNISEIEALRQKAIEHPNTIVDVQAAQKAQQHGRSQDLKLDLCDEVSVRISDQDLSKVLEELLDNAFKFSSDGTPVQVVSSLTDHHLVIDVIDEGRGMTNEQITSVGAHMQFERYFYEQQGSGLGLTIAKLLVELYEGSLTIDSTLDKGTNITIKILRVL